MLQPEAPKLIALAHKKPNTKPHTQLKTFEDELIIDYSKIFWTSSSRFAHVTKTNQLQQATAQFTPLDAGSFQPKPLEIGNYKH